MKNLIIIILCTLLLSAVSLSAPLNNKFISAEARWIIHIDNEEFNKTTLFQCIKEEIKAKGLESKIEEFKATFSFNPLDDIKNITLYGKDKNVCGSFFNTGTLLISQDMETLKNGINVLNGESKSSNNKFLLKKPVKGAFITAVAENINDDNDTGVKENNELFLMSIGENKGKFYIRGSIIAKTIEEATVVNQAIVGAIAIFQLNNQDTQPKLSALSKEIEVILKNRAVSVSFEKETRELIKILKETEEIQKQIKKTQSM